MQIANSMTGSMRIVERSSLTLRAAVIDQHRGGQVQRIRLAERMALQEFKMGLLAALPPGDCLERRDLPADQPGERGRSLLLSDQGGGIFERDLAMPGPAKRRSSMRESVALPMIDRPRRGACGRSPYSA